MKPHITHEKVNLKTNLSIRKRNTISTWIYFLIY